MKNNIFLKYFNHEINQNFKASCILTCISLLFIVTTLVLNINTSIQESSIIYKAASYSENFAANDFIDTIQNQLLSLYNSSINILMISTIIISVIVLRREFSGKSITFYRLGTLPIKKTSIFLSKMIIPIIFAIINYSLNIVIFVIGAVVASKNIKLLKAREYFINQLKMASSLNIEELALSLFIVLTIISLVFFSILIVKKYKIIGVILLLLFGGLLLFSVFMYIGIGAVMYDTSSPTGIYIYFYILPAVITSINMVLFKNIEL